MTQENKSIKDDTQSTVISSINWGENFQKIISKCSEARAYMLGSWWNICEFELDCGLFRLDVMGMTELHHYDDLDKIEVDGIVYELEEIID